MPQIMTITDLPKIALTEVKLPATKKSPQKVFGSQIKLYDSEFMKANDRMLATNMSGFLMSDNIYIKKHNEGQSYRSPRDFEHHLHQ